MRRFQCGGSGGSDGVRLVHELLMRGPSGSGWFRVVPGGSGWFRVVPSGFVLFVLIHIAFPASVSQFFVPCLLGVKS